MSNATLLNLLNNNWKYVLFLVVVWVVATPTYQFKNLDKPDIEFPGEAGDWNISGSSINSVVGADSISVEPNEIRNTFLTKIYQLPQVVYRNHFVRVDADVVSTDVSKTNKKNDEVIKKGKPSLLAVRFEGDNGKKISVEILTAFKPITQRRHYSAMYSVPDFAEGVKIGLLLRQFDYSHTLDTLSLQHFTYTTPYVISVVAIGLFVLVVFFKYLIASSREYRAFNVLVSSAVGVILIGILLPTKYISRILNGAINRLSAYADLSYVSNIEPYQVQGHFVGFAILALLTLCLIKKSRVNLIDTIAKLVLFAVFTEIAQRHSIERSSSFEDLLTDIFGILFGIVCWWVLPKRKKSELA